MFNTTKFYNYMEGSGFQANKEDEGKRMFEKETNRRLTPNPPHPSPAATEPTTNAGIDKVFQFRKWCDTEWENITEEKYNQLKGEQDSNIHYRFNIIQAGIDKGEWVELIDKLLKVTQDLPFITNTDWENLNTIKNKIINNG